MPELLQNEPDPLLRKEVLTLLDQVNAMASTEDERKARYKDIKNKYRDAFEALGHQFPTYN